MARPSSRADLMSRFGAVQKNTVWSWCAVNEQERKVFFSVWTDFTYKEDGHTKYVVQAPDWGVSEGGTLSAARKDHDEKMSLVFDDGYEAYGYFVKAKNKNVIPREIEQTYTSFVMKMKLKTLDDGRVIGELLERIEVR